MSAPVGPALAMVLVEEIPAGLRALDALVKEAQVRVVASGTIQGGRYLILFGGEVEPVTRSHARALEVAGPLASDDVLLPHAEPRILPALRDAARSWPAPGDTLGMLQAGAPPTMLAAVDAALKGALVELVELRVGDGLEGKAIASLWGETPDVEAALALAEAAFARSRAGGCSSAIVRNADASVRRALAGYSGFFKEFRG